MSARRIAAAGTAPRVDRRLQRSATTRAAVVDALLALLGEGDLRPTAPRIAERAGVSLRSVFQHFADLEALFAAAADRQSALLHRLGRQLPAGGRLEPRLAAFVAQRRRVLEAIAPVRRAALLMEPFSPEIGRRLAQSRELGRGEIERVFASELRAHRGAARAEMVAALSVASSFATWEALRVHQRLAPDRAARVMARMLRCLLTA